MNRPRYFLVTAMISCLGYQTASADTVVADRTIRANTLISMADINVISETVPGMISDPMSVTGFEARTNLYVGRPIRPADVGPPALVERNQVIPLIFQAGGLIIVTEGRALGRGGVGERLRVLNLNSRNTVSGRIDTTGAVRVGQ